MKKLKKIVVLGPESTGKSTLCNKLATQFSSTWCPEFAREYLLKNGKNYSFDDLLTIAKGQIALQEKYEVNSLAKWEKETENRQAALQKILFVNFSSSYSPILFLDTDMYVMKVWCEYVFNKCHSFILEKAAVQTCDLYLLCNPDLPWVKDELREYPDLQSRIELYHIYRDILIHQQVPWISIEGKDYENRFHQAVAAVEKLITL